VTRLLERPRITLIVLLVLGLTLVTVSFRSPTAAKLGSVRTLVADVVDPIRGAIDAAFRPFATTVRGAVDYSQAEDKIKKIKKKHKKKVKKKKKEIAKKKK
jgi:rod shape-determining protein MreC